ncbi:MAG: DUF1592 domain-containing protein [Verrucomicrobiota bacterium]
MAHYPSAHSSKTLSKAAWVPLSVSLILSAQPQLSRATLPAHPLELTNETKAFLEKHCSECHDSDTKKGGLDLSSLKLDLADSSAFERWVKIYDRTASGEMPPKKKERPPAKETTQLLSELDPALIKADETRQNAEGRAIFRRLTRVEYENALRDLLDLPNLEVQSLLPADGSRHGFDKIGEALDVSHVQLSKYLEAADRALDQAICTQPKPPSVIKKRVFPTSSMKFMQNVSPGNGVLLKNGQPDPLWPAPGFTDNEHYGQKIREAEAAGVNKCESAVGLFHTGILGWEYSFGFAPIYPGNYRLRLSTWSFQWNAGVVEPAQKPEAGMLHAGGRTLAYFDALSLPAQEKEFNVWLNHNEDVRFDPATLPLRATQVRQRPGGAAAYVGPGIAIDWFEVEGPIFDQWPTSSHRRLFGELPITPFDSKSGVIPPEHPAPSDITAWMWPRKPFLHPAEREPLLHSVSSSNPAQDATSLLSAFLPRAFRRSVSEAEVKRYVDLVQERLSANDCFEVAMRYAYKTALTSTSFLFRKETPGPLNDVALATRLAFWLTNSTPDDTLLALASKGQLRDPSVLREQVERLLNSPQSARFISDFLDQWLSLANIDATDPDAALYPEFSLYLKESMLAESRGFLRELVQRNLPAQNIVKSDFVFVNQRLAEHYGINGVSGTNFRSVPISPDSKRGGFLTQASVLKVTANGTVSSPVVRGIFVTERILGHPVPPPPPGVPAIDPDTRGATTIREQLDKHRADASCAACHEKMDPPGLALESFDVIGGWRQNYRSLDKGKPVSLKLPDGTKVRYKTGPAVDPSGVTRDGKQFGDFSGFQSMVFENPKAITRNLAVQLLTYATGSEPCYADRRELDRIVEMSAEQGYGVRDLIHLLAQSKIFLNK